MASQTGIGSEIQANYLFEQLVGVNNAKLPDIDLYDDLHTIPWEKDSPVFKPVEKVSIEELVAQFNALMAAVDTHITKEFAAGRITGAKYADVYLALMQASMTSAVQFALGKDQAFWLAAKTQAEAITAETQNDVAKLEAMLRRATYALTKLKLATEDSTFGSSEYQRTSILPAQAEMVKEQANAQRAQTANTRYSDGAAVGGLLGVQKLLYEQQITSYQEDTKIKAAKIFSDLWVTQKTIAEGTAPSKYFKPDTGNGTNQALDGVFQKIRVTAMGEDDNY